MNEIDWNDPDAVDSLIGIPDIDPIEGFSSVHNNTGDILDLDDISEIEKKFNLKISIDYNKRQISFFSINGSLIGQIFKDDFLIDQHSFSEHLYVKIKEEFRGNGYGGLLFDIFEFSFQNDVPTEEYGSEISRIKLLLSKGYEVRAIWNGEKFEKIESDNNNIVEGRVYKLYKKS